MREDVLRLNMLEYGADSRLADPAYYRWQVQANPAGLARQKSVYDSDQLVGMIRLLPLRMRLWGRDCLVAGAVNLLIRPEYRQGFTFLRLMRLLRAEDIRQQYKLCYSFPNPASYPGLRRMGWNDVSPAIPLWIRPIRPRRLLARFAFHPWLAAGGSILVPFLFRSRRPGNPATNITVETVASFDEKFDLFWKKIQDKYPVALIRDRAYLSWRFSDPHLTRRRILVARNRTGLVGYAVLQATAIRGIPTGLVMDLLVEPGQQGETAGLLLLAQARAWFQAEGVELAGGLMLGHTQEANILRRAGYWPCPARFAPQSFRAVARIFDPALSTKQAGDPRQWFITTADHDAV